MALLGGGVGGAGNPVGGSFTGPSLGLEIMGDHCYAYSGPVPATTTLDTVLSFTTGNFYTDANFQLSAAVDLSGLGSGVTTGFQIQFNGSTIFLTKCDSTEEDMVPMVSAQFIIPPYTEVTLAIDSTSVTGSTTQVMVGKIYRTRD